MAAGGLPSAATLLAAKDFSPSAEPGPPRGARELADLRTRTSRTYETRQGAYVTQLATESLNFRDTSGRWRKIDNALRLDGSALVNDANRYDLQLPRELGSDPIRMTYGARWVAFEPLGAEDSTAEVDRSGGNTADFSAAWPATTLSYAAESDAVKEQLVLRGPRAPSVYRFRLATSPGLVPALDGSGGVVLRSGGRDTALGFSPPTMVDADGVSATGDEIQLDLDRRGGAWILTLRADPRWLAAGDRAWPVTIDPSVSIDTGLEDCSIVSDESPANCDGETLAVGWDGTSEARTLLRYDTVGLPSGVDVAESWLQYRLVSASQTQDGATVPKQLSLNRVTTPWTSALSWDAATSTTDWTTPGGDVALEPLATFEAGNEWGYVQSPGLTVTIQDWIDGETNNGLLLKDAEPGVDQRFELASSEAAVSAGEPWIAPSLWFSYYPRVGERAGGTYLTQTLDPTSVLKVNVANGDLIYRTEDIRNTAGGVSFGRVYDMFNWMDFGIHFALGWWASTDVIVVPQTADRVAVYMPAGARFNFRRQGAAPTPGRPTSPAR